MGRILVIDDELSLSELIREFLTKFGYNAVNAENGWHGLQMLKNSSFDLVVTDMCMPNIDGPFIVRHIRRSTRPSIPIVGISATPWQFEGVDCDALLRKPFSLMELLETIKRLIPKMDKLKEKQQLVRPPEMKAYGRSLRIW